MQPNLDSEIGLAHFGVETKHETKPNLPNLADTYVQRNESRRCVKKGKGQEMGTG